MTPQQDAVLVALTKPYPRTLDAMALELNMRKPSLRRTLWSLGQLGYGIQRNDSTGEYHLRTKPVTMAVTTTAAVPSTEDSPTA